MSASPEDEVLSVTAPRAAGTVAHGLWTGAFAGLLTGALDALCSWSHLGQYLPGVGGRLLCALFVAGLYAFWMALGGAALGALMVIFDRCTALGPMLRTAAARQRASRSLARVSLAIAAVPHLGAAFLVAYSVGVHTMAVRHHQGLITSVIIGATLACLAVGVLSTFILGRIVEWLLGFLPRRVRHALGAPIAPLVAAVTLLLLGIAIGAYLNRALLDELALRPFVIALVAIAAAVLTAPLARRALARVTRLRGFVHPVIVVVPLLVALLLGGSDAIRKGASAYTGLATPFSVATRRLFDLDRDGYSSVLGGGDCNDLNAAIHPGAVDIPGDGIDQDCSGSDAQPVKFIARTAADVDFVALPASVPADTNIIFITIDTLRADHLGAYGYNRATTPAIDALAAKGTLFLNAWAHAPSTRYSMPAMITGRHPSQVLWDPEARTPASWWPGLKLGNHTIAEIVHERGFATSAILNYEYFDARRRMNQGFDDYDNTNARLHNGTDPASTRGTSSREQADSSIAWITSHKDKRFYLWVHFYDPHADYEKHPGSTSFGDDPMALYDGEIRFTDDQIARVFASLTALGIADKTIIVITGDHGEGFGEHNVQHHGYDLYAAQTKVPLIIYVPGLPPRRVTTPVGHVDILPTIANLAGAPPEPQTMVGRSLVGLIDGTEPDGDRDIYQEVDYEFGGDQFHGTQKRGLVSQHWHLIHTVRPEPSDELYDLDTDPMEKHDVWGSNDVGAKMRERLLPLIDQNSLPPENLADLAGAVRTDKPRPTVATEANFGAELRFLGIDVANPDVHAGESLDVTWYWQVKQQLTGGWRPFVHVEGPAGARFLGDHDPVAGALPMSRWRPGQFIADHQLIAVPPGTKPGTYTVYLGVYDRGKRLAVGDAGDANAGQDRLRVTTVRVVDGL